MSQNVVLKAKGLQTFKNYFGASSGALLEALNVNIDRDEVIQPRRGFATYGTSFGLSTDRTKQLINYKNRIFRHVLDELQYDSDEQGTFATIPGDLNEIEQGLRIKSIEQNGNLYITTSEGIKKLSASDADQLSQVSLSLAGGAKALDLSAMVDYSSPGFLNANSKVAYRLVWGKTDNNDNLILGTPSNRVVVENVAPTSATVNLETSIPTEVDTTYFYQLYRTAVFSQTPTEIDPGDEMYLVLEDFPTATDITNGYIDIHDITPDDIRATGALLYTNPQSGEGITQANDRPPFAKDIALYRNYAFYANTKTVQRLNLAFLSVEDLVSGTSEITITDGTTSTTYTFRGTNDTATLSFGGVFADYHNAIAGTAKYINLTSANDERSFLLYFVYNPLLDLEPNIAGKINIPIDISALTTVTEIAEAFEVETNGLGDFNVTGTAPNFNIGWANNGPVTSPYADTIGASLTYTQLTSGTGEDIANNFVFLPRVPTLAEPNGPTTGQQLEEVANSLVRVVNSQDPLVVGFYVSGFNDIPGQLLFERRTPTGSAFYIYADSDATGRQFNPTLPDSDISQVVSTNEEIPNRVYYSKLQQPEAVPITNYFDVGPKDKEIKRIVALRESLYIFKEDGIYRLSGDAPPFITSGFDFSAIILAPDSAVVLNNQIYVLTSQGIVAVTDSGTSVVSREIEDLIQNLTRPGYAYKTATFGVSYESDRAYHLWTVTSQNDTVATQCYRFNTFTRTWTRWNNSKTCGIVNFADDKLYLGAGDINFIEKERKSKTRTDHADRQYTLNLLTNGVNGDALTVGAVGESEIGDSIIQTQYLTIAQFNRTLKQLDNDNFIKQAIAPVLPDYYDTLQFLVGENGRTKVVGLAQKLDTDPAVNQNDFFSSIDDYTQSIVSTTHTSTQVTINFASNDIENGRYVLISGSNSTPSIDGEYQVIASTPTSITINAAITVDASAGSVQTDVNDFRDQQACFNIITNKLNLDPGVFFSNYGLSTGSIEFESHVIEVDDVDGIVYVNDNLPFIFGPLELYKAFQTTVQYAPQFYGDPSMTKQVSEGTIMFEHSNYSNATLSFSSDLSPYYEPIAFLGQGYGDWGQFSWGNQNWGGVGAPIPFRTLVPLQKQRCRFTNVKFDHKAALEAFAIYGISLTFRVLSHRGYR